MKYGEKELKEFNIDKHLELWENVHTNNYTISVTLPEFTALCPRSGYPDFATIHLEYTPNSVVVELKALKLYINTFRNRYISHEDSANEIFNTLYTKLSPKYMRLTADFYPRGNVHTKITIDSESIK